MRFLTLLVLILSSFSVSAGEYKLLLGSYHVPRGDYCEFNPGFGYTKHGLGVMVYRNSECATSLMWSMTDPINERFSYSIGAATGYSYAAFVPFVSLNMQVTKHTYMGVIPGSLLGEDSVFFYGVNF